MISQSRRKYSSTTGRVAEVRFVRASRHLGITVVKSRDEEDIAMHVDYWISYKNGPECGVDVKGNNLPDEIWCEFKNVLGNPGWMYGKSALIAFDMPEEGGFAIVNRTDLSSYCEKHVEDVFVRDKRDAYKKKYQRAGRKDVITKIYLNDLKSLSSYRVWEYFKEY